MASLQVNKANVCPLIRFQQVSPDSVYWLPITLYPHQSMTSWRQRADESLQSAQEIYAADEQADISDMCLLQSLFPINLSQTTESSRLSVLSSPDSDHSTYPRRQGVLLNSYKPIYSLIPPLCYVAKKNLRGSR